MSAYTYRYLVLNGSFVLLATYSLYYILLEPFAGLSWAACTALPMWVAANWVQQHLLSGWGWALGLHLLSWVVQVHFGHNVAEKRKPALLDSFFQASGLARGCLQLVSSAPWGALPHIYTC